LKLKPELLHSISTLRPPALTRIDYTGTLAKRRAQMITGNKSVQSHLQPEFNRSTNLNYNKCLQVSFTIQTSEFKCSGKQFRVENKLQNIVQQPTSQTNTSFTPSPLM